MRNLENEFGKRTLDNKKILKYGFKKNNGKYIYKTTIYNGQFEMIVELSDQQKTSKLIDIFNEDEYILVDIQDSVGEFVGRVREEYEEKLKDIIKKCSNYDVFKSNQAKDVINYIKDKYNDELEFLWEKFDNNAIWRNKHNNKWYGLLCTLSERKIGIDSDKVVNMIILRYDKDKTNEVIDNKEIYPGYHMNKKSWITIKLDDTMNIDKIYKFIDNSYRLSGGNENK